MDGEMCELRIKMMSLEGGQDSFRSNVQKQPKRYYDGKESAILEGFLQRPRKGKMLSLF